MGRAIDLTGQRFGRLVALRDVGSLRAFRLWAFQCDCGAIIERTTADVRHGKVSSCGCYQRQATSDRTSLKLAGRTFGRLTVLQRVGTDRHGHVEWLCRCQCGEEKVLAGISLTKGTTRSCGCLRRDVAAQTQRAKTLSPSVKKAHIAASRAKQRKRRKSDPIIAMQTRLSRLHRHALRQVGAIKTSPTFEQLGYTVEAFVAHIERQFVKGMGWHNMGEWQLDHIVPVKEARTEADVISLNQLSNLRPMWSEANNAKKAKRTNLL